MAKVKWKKSSLKMRSRNDITQGVRRNWKGKVSNGVLCLKLLMKRMKDRIKRLEDH